MVSLVPAYWALGAFFAVLALLVLAARPGARVNQLLFALLALEAAAAVTFQYMREAPTDELARYYSHFAHWYFIPEMFLMAWLLRELPPVRPWGWWRPILAVAGLLTLGRFALFVLGEPPELQAITLGTGGFRGVGTLDAASIALPYDIAVYAVQALGVWLCAREAVSPQSSALIRRKAGVVGLAFALLLATGVVTATLFLGEIALGLHSSPATLGGVVRSLLLSAIWLPVLLWSIPRLAQGFEGRHRVAYLAIAWGALGMVVLDYAVGLARGAGGLFDLIGLGNGRIIYLAGFAACLATALLRYDIAGLGGRMRQRIGQLAFATLAGAVLLLPAGAAVALTNGNVLALAAAVFLVGAALTFMTGPLRDAARRAAGAFLVPADDPAALTERARLYSEALEKRLGPGGVLRGQDETTLRALRRELDITDREHALLLETMRQRRRGPHAATPAVLGRYVVQRELGRGAFGTALLATDPVTGKDVVLKRFHAGKGVRRALAEARALKAVRHPRVVPLLDVQEAGEEVFLVLAYAEGGSLADLLKREGPLPARRATELAMDVLDGLAVLHAAGLVHRDVKPSNILLDKEGRAMLGDFGAARFVAGSEAELTMTGTDVLGSLITVAPEVLRGEPHAPTNDLYAVAAVLYRCLTGQHYLGLEGKNAVQARQAILHDPPRLPHPRVPPALGRVLGRGLAKRPSRRYPAAAAMRQALAGDLAEAGAARPAAASKARRTRRGAAST